MAEINNDTKEKKFIYSNSLYVHNLPEKKVFDNLSIGTDSYQDVKKIAPCTELITIKSSSIDSYSLIDNGDVIVCTYKRSEDNNLIISSISVVSKDSPMFPYSQMMKSDLCSE